MRRSDGHPADELTALLDGELSREEAAAVRAHVDECPECSEELRSLASVRDLIRQLPTLELPPGFYDRPRPHAPAMLTGERTGQAVRHRRLAVAALSAAAALALMVALPDERSGPEPPVPSLARGPAPQGPVRIERVSQLTPVVVPVRVPVTSAP